MENQEKKSFWKTNFGLFLKYFGWELPLFILIWQGCNLSDHVSNAQLNQTGAFAPDAGWTPTSTIVLISFIVLVAGVAIWYNWDEVKNIFKKK
jgi:hypothetical protein